MQSVITDFQGMNVILRDDSGNRHTLSIFDICGLEVGDQVLTTVAGKEVPVTIDRFEQEYAVLEFVNPDGSIRTFDMEVRELAGIHIGQKFTSTVLQIFE